MNVYNWPRLCRLSSEFQLVQLMNLWKTWRCPLVLRIVIATINLQNLKLMVYKC